MKFNFDVIIIGGSYAGLSAAMSLGRSCRKVLIVDSGWACNKVVDHSHNFLSRDGEDPAKLAAIARKEVLQYPDVTWQDGELTEAIPLNHGVQVTLRDGNSFTGKKLLFCTGLTDIMPGIAGFSECWGHSILHCPYCHGYEVKGHSMAVTANGDHAFHLCVLLKNITKEITLFTNGPSQLSAEQSTSINKLGIAIFESPIEKIIHKGKKMKGLQLVDGSEHSFPVMFAKVLLHQQCEVPERMGCKFQEHLIVVDDCQRTSISNVYAAGDNCRLPRTISLAVAAGTQAGFMINWDLSIEDLNR